MQALRRGSHVAAYGVAWAGAREAVPLLREGLLRERYFYGWESSDAPSIEARTRDEQYPRHVARILALEHLTGRPIREAVGLTQSERGVLAAEAMRDREPGGPGDVARWLLLELSADTSATLSERGGD